jgi:hypothetical protein
MIIHTSNYENYENSTICIEGCQKDWLNISTFLTGNFSDFKIKSNAGKNSIESKDKYLDSFKIIINDLIDDNQFTISIEDDSLIFNGAIKSFNNFKNSSDEFAKDYTAEGDHVHLSYIDDWGDYNWFSNKNIDLILAVRSDF